MTWLDSTETPRTANLQEPVKNREKENVKSGMNHDSSVLFQSAWGCHSNHTELSLYLAPSTALPACLGAEGNLHRFAAVLVHIILFLYILILYHFFSWAIIKETKSCQTKYTCVLTYFYLIKCNKTVPHLPFSRLHISASLICLSLNILTHIYTPTPFECQLIFLKKYSEEKFWTYRYKILSLL